MNSSTVPGLRDAIQSARQQHRAGAGAVLDILLRMPGVRVDRLCEHLEAEAGVAMLAATGDSTADFSMLDLPTAKAWRCVVLAREGLPPLMAAEDPWDDALLQRVSRRIGREAMPAAATREGLERLLGNMPAVDRQAPASAVSDAVARAAGPIVGFVDAAIRAAFGNGASDVHFECDRGGVTVKHRLDGVMKQFARMDGVLAAQEVISRIKVLAQLDITERRLPQDGRFRFSLASESVDMRVSIMPSVFGEDAVLRLLDKAQLRSRSAAISLDLLGFEPHNAQLIRDLAGEPSGMLLVTGPTGSGKTTTLYAVLSEINTGVEKIITIEDPVEYELPGVLQIPVNERKGLTFAKGLRSILRHDPDRILVGEIRDAETAEIAVQSSLTGHLVFTTVHANSMTDIMGRFRHFGLDMFGFMSSLNGVVVQRLVRELCAHCAGTRPTADREREWLGRLGHDRVASVPRAVGCGHCGAAGYRGRFVIAEVHVVDDALRDHVTEGAPVSILRKHGTDSGVESLCAQAARRVLQGRTTLEEIKRVVGWV